MAINSNNNAVFTAGSTTFGDVAIEYFTVTVKDSSDNALDIDANTHKDGIVDRILQAIQTRGTIKYYNVTTTNGVITVAVERETTWGDSDGNVASPTATPAANMQTYLQSLGSVRCRASSTSTTDDATIDVGGTTVAVVANI
jgi:hypothetical protein